jgi:ABC-type nitrate/sulfonate/bicarbonate transport system ATPase subunit
MAFQNAALLPWRTTLDNVVLPLEIIEPYRSSSSRDRARHIADAEQLLASVGLGGCGQMFPWQLSGGMQQRVSRHATARFNLPRAHSQPRASSPRRAFRGARCC